MQSRWESFRESCVQVGIGFALSFVTQSIVYPAFHIRVVFWQNVAITAIFTVVSLARQFVVRRWFNGHPVAFCSRETPQSIAKCSIPCAEPEYSWQ